jgi:hypothetical protein
MERTPEPAPELSPQVAAPGVMAPAQAAGSVARLLALQRSAGNAAVARMLAVQREAAAGTGRVDTPVGIVYARPDIQSEHVAELP